MRRKAPADGKPFRLKHFELVRRAAVSVPANIAEGAARAGKADFARFLMISRGSLVELDTLLWLAKDPGFTEDISAHRQSLEACFAKLNGLIRSLGQRA